MSSRAPATCQHELRPGTKVCLHCRRAEREARAAHRNRIFVRITVTTIGLAVGAAVVRAGLQAMERGDLPELPQLMAATTKAIVESLPGKPAASPESASVPAMATVSGPAVAESAQIVAMTDSAGTVGTAPAPDSNVVAISAMTAAPATPGLATAPAPVATPAPVPAPISPIVAEGRTDLSAGIFAVRAGDTVTVYFDTPDARTRRAEKFEQIVRSTLPLVHGAAADAVLGVVAPGGIVGTADLVNDLPTRGVHLRAADGRAISLWPETRPGRDGPLVVAYRAIQSR
jgi:hypothetical protein